MGTAWVMLMVLAAAPGGGLVRALTVEGETIEGRFEGVNASGAVVIARDDGEQALAADSLMQLTWAEVEPTTEMAKVPPQAASSPAQTASPPAPAASGPAQAQGLTIYFNDGSQLTGRITGGDGRNVTLHTSLRGEMSVPLAELAAVQFGRGDNSQAEAAFVKALQQRDATEDSLILLHQGRVTTLRGVVELIEATGGRFKWRGRSVAIEPQRTYGLVLARGAQHKLAAPASCRLRDGQIVAGHLSASDAEHVQIQPLHNGRATGQAGVKLPVNQVAEVRFNSDRVTFLDELDPEEYTFEPFAMTPWLWRANRSTANRPLRMGGRVFDRGIGMHSQGTLVYDLTDGFTRLAGLIGIDDAVRPLGNVVFKVLADDKEVFDSGPVTGRDQPRKILVPIAGAKRLKLVVEFGEDLDIGDQADWANVRLLK